MLVALIALLAPAGAVLASKDAKDGGKCPKKSHGKKHGGHGKKCPPKKGHCKKDRR